MSRYYFDMDYSGYVIEHFPAFEREHARLARRFTNTVDVAYDRYSWMKDEPLSEMPLPMRSMISSTLSLIQIFSEHEQPDYHEQW